MNTRYSESTLKKASTTGLRHSVRIERKTAPLSLVQTDRSSNGLSKFKGYEEGSDPFVLHTRRISRTTKTKYTLNGEEDSKSNVSQSN